MRVVLPRGRRVLVPALLALGVGVVACNSAYTTEQAPASNMDASVPPAVDAGNPQTSADGSIYAPEDADTVPDASDAEAGSPCALGQDFSMDPLNCGSCRHACNFGGDCVAGECKRVVFVAVPSSSTTGNLGGLSGADKTCQAAAAKSLLKNTFLAWLGDSNGSPQTRFVKSKRPYILADGTTQVSGSFAIITAGMGLMHPINQDADGKLTTMDRAWTNVDGSGNAVTAGNNACAMWTSALSLDRAVWGNTAGNGGGWTAGGDDSCFGGSHGIYCFEQ